MTRSEECAYVARQLRQFADRIETNEFVDVRVVETPQYETYRDRSGLLLRRDLVGVELVVRVRMR